MSLRTQVQREDVLTQSHLMTQSRCFRNRKLYLIDTAESELGREVALFTILGMPTRKFALESEKSEYKTRSWYE